MFNRVLGSIALVLALSLYTGCSHSSSDSTASDAPATTAPAARPIPPDSIFAKVKVGDERDKVFATIGQPTSISTYQTGKAFIPFHYGGGDDVRMAAHYKGVGIITFANDSAYTSGYSVIDVTYNPDEPGY